MDKITDRFPSCFLFFEPFKALLGGVLDSKRPMDNMKLHFDLPQEDELATQHLSWGASYYLALYFMRSEEQLRHLVAFDPDDAPGVSREQVTAARDSWSNAFLHLCRKLTLRAERRRRSPEWKGVGGPPRLLLKSPIHTARIPLIRKLFPRAKFIYLHRHPLEVRFGACVCVHTHTHTSIYLHTYIPIYLYTYIPIYLYT